MPRIFARAKNTIFDDQPETSKAQSEKRVILYIRGSLICISYLPAMKTIAPPIFMDKTGHPLRRLD